MLSREDFYMIKQMRQQGAYILIKSPGRNFINMWLVIFLK